MRSLIRVAVVAALLALLAPGASASTVRHLHKDDSGRTIHVHHGDTITVRLPGGSGGYHVPSTSDRSEVKRTSKSGGFPSNKDARASFRARHPGFADLTSYTDYACLHTQPRCVPPQRDWIVHVVVS
jgi:hypothetical protein